MCWLTLSTLTLTMPETPFFIENVKLILAQVDTFKYLAGVLNNELSWSPYVEVVCPKAQKVLGLLYRCLM